jgi:protein-disulfide isomerase
VLGTEDDLVANFVATGQIRMIFWPVINHGQPSVNATLAAHCAGVQDPALFWPMHRRLFEEQNALWRADLDFFVETARAVGADPEAFTACYGSQEALDTLFALDEMRRQRGIFSQPTFDLNGEVLAGAQPYEVFARAIENKLP